MKQISNNKPSHLKALLKKNWIIMKRHWFITLLEILIPIIFASMAFSIKAGVPDKVTPQTTYYTMPRMNFNLDGALSDLSLMKDCGANENGGKVALAPAGDDIVAQLETIFDNAGFETEVFNSNEDIDAATQDADYGKLNGMEICFAIVMNKNAENHKYEYMLRFNVSDVDDNEDIPNTKDPRVEKLVWSNIETLELYGRNGFLVVQNLVDNLILQKETTPAAHIHTRVTSRTVEETIKDEFYDGIKGGQLAFYIDLPLRLPFLRLLNALVREKEQKIREGMKIMGLQSISFYLSWFITYFIIFSLCSLVISGNLLVGLYDLSSFGYILLWHWEYTICLLGMAFFLSVFFNNARKANILGLVISIAMTFLQGVALDTSSSGTHFGLSFLPPTSFGMAGDHFLALQSAQLGVTSDTVTKTVLNYNILYHYFVTAFMIVFFFLGGAYLDQVLPSEFGIKKHPLFCLRKKNKNQRTRVGSSDKRYDSVHLDQEGFEEVEPGLKSQDENNQSVKVKNLRKVFGGKKVAVNGVSFNMYKGQIFALLGHNGAGKTTTISMITGLISPTEGTTNVFGLDVNTELDDVRKSMGVCPQHDVLFADLTVKEHLEMFAVFKGMKKKEIPEAVEKIVRDLGLEDKKDYLSKNLSGGQKRKLSVGIAFIGGSKFILLDEPSSGMDTYARRKMWELLENYKHDRVILLTTHFMDEADYLGDRIGIMAEGKLRCLGSSLFLKTKFGAGYNLTLVKKDINTPSQPIKTLVQSHVPKSKVLSDVSAELIFQLPLEETPKFQNLFNELDSKLNEFKVNSYGISVTTLEEVFLNVAKLNSAEKHLDSMMANTQTAIEAFNSKTDRITNPWKLFCIHFYALVQKKLQYFKRDKAGLFLELFLPVIIAIIGILTGSSVSDNSIVSLALNDNLYGSRFPLIYNEYLPSSLVSVDPNFIERFNPDYFQSTPTAASDLADFDEFVFEKREQDILSSTVNVFSLFMQDLDTGAHSYEYTTLVDTRAQEASPFAMNRINNAILQYATGEPEKEITLVISPFKKTKGEGAIDNISSGFLYTFSFAIGMSFIAGSLITFIVKEREMNAKHQQIVSGVSYAAYWFSNFFVDYVKYLIPAVLNVLIAMAADAESLVEGDKLGGFWTVFILYGLALIPFIYLTSFLFTNYGNAQVASFFFHFALGFIVGTVAGILRLFEATDDAAYIMQWIFRPIPTFTMTSALISLAFREVFVLQGTADTILKVFDIKIVGADVLVLIGSAVVYTFLLFFIEFFKNQQLFQCCSKTAKVPYIPKPVDDDVEREALEVERSDNKTYAIKVDKLRKVYSLGKGKHKVAVDRVSFGVKNGDCFALLGTNGAGKTTTFKILSGDYVQTSGKVAINGFRLPNQFSKARHDIGYCPQFDTLLENLTAREHLFLYAAIKGVPADMRELLVEQQLVQMNLKQYENIPAGTYSGGNKRKLSVAIAMIGNPSVVFLDEPSTGMDPEARRFMWNVISRISKERKQSSVILTTHSMEEAEALATKMGIMVNGNMKCMGTCQHIKSKFGGGYEIEVKLNIPSIGEIDAVVKSLKAQGIDKRLLDKTDVDLVLEKLQALNLKEEISETGVGSSIYQDLNKGKIDINLLVSWVMIEKNGSRLKTFLERSFGEITLIEHFQAFYRFKVPKGVTIGKFFGDLEQHKEELSVLNYSISQGSIEQIFNFFASEDDHEKNNKEDHIRIQV